MRSGFHHLHVIMRLRRANSGIDMNQQLIDSLRKSGAKVFVWCLRPRNLKFRMFSSGFQILYFKMR